MGDMTVGGTIDRVTVSAAVDPSTNEESYEEEGNIFIHLNSPCVFV